MKCERVGAELDAYLDGELEEELAAEVARHIEECPACRELLAGRRGVAAAVRRLPALAVPAGFTEGFRAARLAAPERPRRADSFLSRRLNWMLGSAAAAAAALLLAAVLIPGRRTSYLPSDRESLSRDGGDNAAAGLKELGRPAAKDKLHEGEACPDTGYFEPPKRRKSAKAPAPAPAKKVEEPQAVPHAQPPGAAPAVPKAPAPTPPSAGKRPAEPAPKRNALTDESHPEGKQAAGKPVARQELALPESVRALARTSEGNVRAHLFTFAAAEGKKTKLPAMARSRGAEIAAGGQLTLHESSAGSAAGRLVRMARSLGGGKYEALVPAGGGEAARPAKSSPFAAGKRVNLTGKEPRAGSTETGFGIASVPAREGEEAAETLEEPKGKEAESAARTLVLYLPEDQLETFALALSEWSAAKLQSPGGRPGGSKATSGWSGGADYRVAGNSPLGAQLDALAGKTGGVGGKAGERYVLVVIRLEAVGGPPPAAKQK